MRARRNQTVVGLRHSFMEIRMLHVASIDKETFMDTLFAGRIRFGNKACNTAQCCFHPYWQQILTIATTIHIGNALTQRTASQVHEFLAITMKCETDFRIYQYDTLESGQNIIEFSGIGLQELTTSRNVKEEIADRKATTHST